MWLYMWLQRRSCTEFSTWNQRCDVVAFRRPANVDDVSLYWCRNNNVLITSFRRPYNGDASTSKRRRTWSSTWFQCYDGIVFRRPYNVESLTASSTLQRQRLDIIITSDLVVDAIATSVSSSRADILTMSTTWRITTSYLDGQRNFNVVTTSSWTSLQRLRPDVVTTSDLGVDVISMLWKRQMSTSLRHRWYVVVNSLYTVATCIKLLITVVLSSCARREDWWK